MRFCAITGCGEPASLVVVSPADGAARDVCRRCAEELIAVWGYQLAEDVSVSEGRL